MMTNEKDLKKNDDKKKTELQNNNHVQKSNVDSGKVPSFIEKLQPYLHQLGVILKAGYAMACAAWRILKPIIIEIGTMIKIYSIKFWYFCKTQYQKHIDKKSSQP